MQKGNRVSLNHVLQIAITATLLIIANINTAYAERPFKVFAVERGVAAWIDGGYNAPGSNEAGSGKSGGVGFRLGPVGFNFSQGDVSDAPKGMKRGISSFPGVLGGTRTGDVYQDPEKKFFAFDLNVYMKVLEYGTIYAGPGIFSIERRPVYKAANSSAGEGIRAGEDYLAVDRKEDGGKYTWNAGAQIKIPVYEEIKLLIGSGYHSMRGVIVQVGIAIPGPQWAR